MVKLSPSQVALIPAPDQAEKFIACYEQHIQAISECSNIEDAQIIVDTDKLYEAFFKITKDKESERLAKICRMLAERKCGEFLAKIKTQERGDQMSLQKRADHVDGPLTKRSVIASLGIPEKTAREYQKLAKIPEQDYYRIVKLPEQRLTTKAIVETANQNKPKQSKYKKPQEDLVSGKPNLLERYVSELDSGLTQCVSAFRRIRNIANSVGGLTDDERTTFINVRLERIAKNLQELSEFFQTTDTRNILRVIK